MRLKLLLLVTALAAIITACGEPVRSGVVVEKHYEPPREWTSTEWRCLMRDPDTYACTFNMPYEKEHYDPEEYRLYLQGEREGKVAYGWVTVTSSDYDKCIVGRKYPDCLPT